MSGRNRKVPLKPWETAGNGVDETSYIRLGMSLLMHPAVLSLKPLTLQVYIYMVSEAKGHTAFTFPKRVYSKICSMAGFQKARDELIKKGFIEIVVDNRHTGKDTKYKFCDRWREFETMPEGLPDDR